MRVAELWRYPVVDAAARPCAEGGVDTGFVGARG
jgi:hypothetical protein